MSNVMISMKNRNLVLKPLSASAATKVTSDTKKLKKVVILAPVSVKSKAMPGSSCQTLQDGNVTINKDQKRDEIEYRSVDGDFRKESTERNFVITQEFNRNTQLFRTKARITNAGEIIEITSDKVERALGQSNYQTVLKALLTVPNEELKLQAIFALVTARLGSTTEKSLHIHSKSCQTNESSFSDNSKFQMRKRIRRAQTLPYMVTDQLLNQSDKRSTILNKADTIKKVQSDNSETVSPMDTDDDIQSLQLSCMNGDSNLSVLSLDTDQIKRLTASVLLEQIDHVTEGNNPEETNKKLNQEKQNVTDWSTQSFENSHQTASSFHPTSDSILSHVAPNLSQTALPLSPNSLFNQSSSYSVQQIGQYPITMLDGYTIMVPVKPEDQFHQATRENLKSLDSEDRRKLILHQICIDLKYALEEDEDGNLPIHQAVLTNDKEWLQRQAIALKSREETVDIPARGGMTALQMSLYQDTSDCCTALLELGADPLLLDNEGRAILHLAAERGADHLHDILDVCKQRARAIVSEHDETWSPGWQSKTDDELVQTLMDHLCAMVDDQGYTPLMIASKIGNYSNVQLLVEASPCSVDCRMPNSGNTALYLAIGAACMDAGDRGNKSEVADNFGKTVRILILNGACLNTKNDAGVTPYLLLQEFHNTGLNLLVSQIMTSKNTASSKISVDSFILVKDENGECHSFSAFDKLKLAGNPGTTANPDDSAGADENVLKKSVPMTELKRTYLETLLTRPSPRMNLGAPLETVLSKAAKKTKAKYLRDKKPSTSNPKFVMIKTGKKDANYSGNSIILKKSEVALKDGSLRLNNVGSSVFQHKKAMNQKLTTLDKTAEAEQSTTHSGNVAPVSTVLKFQSIAPRPPSEPRVFFKTFKLVNRKLIDRTNNSNVKILNNTLIGVANPNVKTGNADQSEAAETEGYYAVPIDGDTEKNEKKGQNGVSSGKKRTAVKKDGERTKKIKKS